MHTDPANAVRDDSEPPVGSRSQRDVNPMERLVSSESTLWRLTLVVVIALAIGFAFLSWTELRALPLRLEALPIGLVVLVILFAVYALSKTRQMAELRGMIHGLEQRNQAAPDLNQLEKL